MDTLFIKQRTPRANIPWSLVLQCTSIVTKSRTVSGTVFRYQHRCGNCLPCRIRRRDEWATRILLESWLHPCNWFVTLTYREDIRPRIAGSPQLPWTLRKADLQGFLKRLRYYSPVKLRYFAVGEYGDHSGHPHYHMALFGKLEDPFTCIEKAWPREHWGRWDCRPLIPERARYLAGYCVKKLTQRHMLSDGRDPEFVTMSRNKGLAYHSAPEIANAMRRYGVTLHGFRSSDSTANPEASTLRGYIRFGKSLWPLDQYLKRTLLPFFPEESPTELQAALRADVRERMQLHQSPEEKAQTISDSDARAANLARRRLANARI